MLWNKTDLTILSTLKLFNCQKKPLNLSFFFQKNLTSEVLKRSSTLFSISLFIVHDIWLLRIRACIICAQCIWYGDINQLMYMIKYVHLLANYSVATTTTTKISSQQHIVQWTRGSDDLIKEKQCKIQKIEQPYMYISIRYWHTAALSTCVSLWALAVLMAM